MTVGIDKRVLHHFFRVFRLADDLHRQYEQRTTVSLDQSAEPFRLSVKYAPDALLFVRWIHICIVRRCAQAKGYMQGKKYFFAFLCNLCR